MVIGYLEVSLRNVWRLKHWPHKTWVFHMKNPFLFLIFELILPLFANFMHLINSWSSHVAVSVSCTAWQRSPEWAIPQWLCWCCVPINQLCAEHIKWFHWCTVCPAGVTAHMKYCGVTQKYCCMSECGSITCVFVCVCHFLLCQMERGVMSSGQMQGQPGVYYIFVIIHCHDSININITLMSQYHIFTSLQFTFWYTVCVQKSQTVNSDKLFCCLV